MGNADDDTALRWPQPPDPLDPKNAGEVHDPVFAVSLLLHLARTTKILERGAETEAALERIRHTSGEWSAAQEAKIVRDAFRIVDDVIHRVLPNPWWSGRWRVSEANRPAALTYLRSEVQDLLREEDDLGKLAGRLRALAHDGNEGVEEVMTLLRDFFENLVDSSRATETVLEPVRPDPSAAGRGRVRRGGPGRDPSILAECVRALLPHPEIAALATPTWVGPPEPFPYKNIKNTRELRERLSVVLAEYPYSFEPEHIDPRYKGPLWQILNGIQRDQ